MITTVLVHKGVEYFPYIGDCVDQFFLFNPGESLILIADREFPEVVELAKNHPGFKVILTTDLKPSREHAFFSRWNRMKHSTFRGGFWRFAIERFFLLSDFMQDFGLETILHFEYDNMMYFPVKELESRFAATSKGLSLPLDSPKRSVPSILFIKNPAAIKDFCRVYNRLFLIRKMNDMRALYLYSLLRRDRCSYLPVIPSTYREGKKELRSIEGKTTKRFDLFDRDFETFGGIFDAAAIGQFLGGIDPRNDPYSTPGYVNEDAMYSALDFNFSWEGDSRGRFRPILSHAGRSFPIFNLHVHSKALNKFRSDRPR